MFALILSLLFTTTFLPLFTKFGKCLSLLVIPQSLSITLRMALISFIVFELNVVSMNNINENFHVASKLYSCEMKSFGELFEHAKREKVLEFQLLGPIKAIVDGIKKFIELSKKIFRSEFVEYQKITFSPFCFI